MIPGWEEGLRQLRKHVVVVSVQAEDFINVLQE